MLSGIAIIKIFLPSGYEHAKGRTCVPHAHSAFKQRAKLRGDGRGQPADGPPATSRSSISTAATLTIDAPCCQRRADRLDCLRRCHRCIIEQQIGEWRIGIALVVHLCDSFAFRQRQSTRAAIAQTDGKRRCQRHDEQPRATATSRGDQARMIFHAQWIGDDQIGIGIGDQRLDPRERDRDHGIEIGVFRRTMIVAVDEPRARQQFA
ncbi:hypothetical protein [Burkholderia sp. TSV86]|uniref:hypothetical protein n=1 Tax=Burkholderia sp. TSV86 TaxID=1385594 RepID=UPI001E4D414A|nr:hypothetical protein [Burkholderia sp. TSV86]